MKNKWLVLGDCHGDITPFWNLAQKYDITTTAIIQLGDLGCNFYLNGTDKKMKYKLNKIGFTIYVVRGNHEARPSLLPNTVELYDSNVDGIILYEPEYPNIRYFLDKGGNYTINGKKCLVVPGAYSVDKEYRLQNGWTWFPDEQLNERERNELRHLLKNKYDYIFAHTCPLSTEFYINDLFLSNIDQSKIDQTTEKFLDEIISSVEFERLYFGHFHGDRDIDVAKSTMLYKEYVELGDGLKEKWRKLYE